jgi:NADPH:quinone reductase-like Zn-dependent oxidoreductase
MKAIRYHEVGDASVLRYDDVDVPTPSARQLVVKVYACGVNHGDLDLRSGKYRINPPLPHTLGLEFAGEIVDRGAQVSNYALGDRVMAAILIGCGNCRECQTGNENACTGSAYSYGIHRPGGYAEYCIVEAADVVRLPVGVSWETAACMNGFATAYHMLFTLARLQMGESVLVLAAGSGVGRGENVGAGVDLAGRGVFENQIRGQDEF